MEANKQAIPRKKKRRKMIIKKKLFQNKVLSVILFSNDDFKTKQNKVILKSFCGVCGCDPCDCTDWFGGLKLFRKP